MVDPDAVEGVQVSGLRDHRLVVVPDVYTILLREDHLALPGASHLLHHLREQIQVHMVNSRKSTYSKICHTRTPHCTEKLTGMSNYIGKGPGLIVHPKYKGIYEVYNRVLSMDGRVSNISQI